MTHQIDARDKIGQDRLRTEAHQHCTDTPNSQQGLHVDPQDGEAHEAATTNHHPAGQATHRQHDPLQGPPLVAC